MQADALQAAHPQERESVLVLQAPELSLHGGASAVEAPPLVTVARDANVALAHVLAERDERDVLPVIPIKGERASQIVMPIIEEATRFNPRIQRHTDEFRYLYRRRVAVEREFGRLKHDYALAPLRVRGLARVQLHADLCILARLALALSRARAQAVPLAA